MSAFLQPWMLWGLGLASVPILIHLLNRRRHQTVRWAAMDFLRAAYKKNQRRLRFENLLLLLVRTALIVLLVFALARPFLSGGVASALGSGAVNYTVVLDNSYSMGLNEGVTTPFERAVEEARRIAGAMDTEDSFTLYLTNDDFAGARPGVPRAVLRDSHEPDKIRNVLSRLTVSSGRADMTGVLAAVADPLDAKTPAKQVVILTDLTRRAWQGVADAGERPDAVPEAPRDLSGAERTIEDLLSDMTVKGATIQIVDVGAPTAENVAILDFGPVEDRPLVEGSAEAFRARVANYGRRPVSVDVSFSVDGRHKGAARVDLPGALALGAPGEKEVRFTFPNLEAGPRTFEAELPSDPLPIDDRRLFVADVRERIRVLAVDGDPTGDTPETWFLRPAIALRNEDRGSRIEMDEVDTLSFLNRDLAPYDLVILANVDRIREEKVDALEAFVKNGGGLVVFLGDKVDPALTNRVLWADGEGLLPGVLADRPVSLDRERNPVAIDLNAPPHPLFADILGTEEDPVAAWRAPKVWGYYPVTPPEDDENVSVLLRLTDAAKNPALLEREYGKGKVLLFTTSADTAWADMASTFVMPILWHEMVYYLTATDPSQRNIRPFEAFTEELPERILEVQITTPDGSRVKVAPQIREGRLPQLVFRDTEEPGRYLVNRSTRGANPIDAGTKRSTGLFAVNVDAEEGDVRPIAAGEIENRYAGLPITTGKSWAGAAGEAAVKPQGEIWKGLLGAVLALLFLEIFLARRFGDYARRFRRPEVTA